MKSIILLFASLLFFIQPVLAQDIDFSLSFPKENFTAFSGINHVCAESGTSSKPFFGLIFAGDALNYVDIDEDENYYRLIMSQKEENNKFIIPASLGGCIVIPIKMLNYDELLSTTGAFVPMHSSTKIIIEYPGVDIVGAVSGVNKFSLLLKKEIAGNTRIVVDKK